MGKVFNVTGACSPEKHYMVDITGRLKAIKELVDKGDYFTVNRARQYGKTTTLRALCTYLKDEYCVVFMDFQFLSQASFANESTFVCAFARELSRIAKKMNIPEEVICVFKKLSTERDNDLGVLFYALSDWCDISDKPIVLIIDEVDSATNNQVFLDFLAQLRGYYLDREYRPIFQSVILSGVHDIKNIKRKISHDDVKKVNSPWNIAADFEVAMNFSKEDIIGMLDEYEKEHHTGMNIELLSGLISDYTSGYPFLVSRICKIIDEKIEIAHPWTKEGFLEAIKIILSEKNALFESLINKLTDYPEIRSIVYEILFKGKDISYTALNKSIDTAEMFGFVVNKNNRVAISNRIFETILYDYFLSEEFVENNMYDAALRDKNQFIDNGQLNMKLVLEKFVEAFEYIYGDENEKFIEEIGRKY